MYLHCKLNKLCLKNTCYSYESISNSKFSGEYLVIKENDYKNIYIIDIKYNEICSIKLNVPSKYLKKINSISFDSENCKIYIGLDSIVYSVTMQGDFIKEELSRCAIDKIKDNCIKLINYRCCNVNNAQNIKIT